MTAIATFDDWVADRALKSIGTNHGSQTLPFQSWQKFKEAFAPELVYQAVNLSSRPVSTIIDPFGGSGTTALAAQFMGIAAITSEVNPYLADLIQAKLCKYDLGRLRTTIGTFTSQILALADGLNGAAAGWVSPDYLPATFVEPGVNERWIFSKQTAQFLYMTIELASAVPDAAIARLLKVLIGGQLVALSNVRVSGKGRRYRSGWLPRQATPSTAARAISSAIQLAAADIETYNERHTPNHRIIRGDSRSANFRRESADLAVFSPPYPNSFDYTDVYNVELWMLGYLRDKKSNTDLRHATLSSHVQVHRNFAKSPTTSPLLTATLARLNERLDDLWDLAIPNMIGAYFADMANVLRRLRTALKPDSELWMVVGDSKYADTSVPVADILSEVATAQGYELLRQEPFRSMRSSPQHGGNHELSESLIVLKCGHV